MDKSDDAFRTISEVADELDIPQHVLRFWETRFAQIKPLKRGGGRRYYRPDDVYLLKGIRHLLYSEGYTIKGVQRILKEQGVRFVASIATEGFDLEQLTASASEEVAAEKPKAKPAKESLLGKLVGGKSAKTATDAVAVSGVAMNDQVKAKLQGTLMELLECKRLLDQVR
jgi:DNA-binding transcriptional MerR regulator